jgi:hypothetical protein
MAAFRFPQNRGKVSSDQGETLLNVTRYRYFGSCFRHSILPGKNPKSARTIIDLEGAPSHDTIGIDDLSSNRDLFARIPSRISVYFLDADSRRAPGQQQNPKSHTQHRNDSGM